MTEVLEMPTKEQKKLKKGKARKGEAVAPEGADKRALKRKRLAEANKQANTQTVILETEVRKFIVAEARASGMDMAHYIQKIIESHVVASAGTANPLARRIAAKRAVLDRVVELASDMAAKGEFEPHFIASVVKRASGETAFIDNYETAIDAKNENKRQVARAQIPINQQIGRLVKRAAGARSKRDASGKIMRAQIQGEIIKNYTQLEMPPVKG